MSVTSLSHCAHWRLLPESSSSITGCRVDCYRVNVSLKHRLRSRLHRMLHINATRSQGTLKNNRSVFIFYWVERYQNSSPHTLKSHHSNPVITVNTKNFTQSQSHLFHINTAVFPGDLLHGKIIHMNWKLSAACHTTWSWSALRLWDLSHIHSHFLNGEGLINRRTASFDPTINAL